MSEPLAHVQTPTPSLAPPSGPTLVSLVAAKAGREAVWLLIAGAFLVVEGLIFLTGLPSAKIFHRRESAKPAGHGRH